MGDVQISTETVIFEMNESVVDVVVFLCGVCERKEERKLGERL